MIEENKENCSTRKLNRSKTTAPEFQKSIGQSIPTLICGQFQESVWIGFGCVNVGMKTTRQFKLINPENSEMTLSVEKCPSKKGFSIFLSGDGATSITLAPQEQICGFVHWTPTENMSVREVALIKINSRIPLQLTLHGISGIGEHLKQEKQKKKPQQTSMKSLLKSRMPTEHQNAALTKKSVGKKTKSLNQSSGNAKDEMTQKKNLIDNKWADKQVSSLCQWINYKFSQHKHEMDILDKPGACAGSCGVFGAVERKRLLEQYRSEMESILERRDVSEAVNNIEEEIRCNRMCIRSDQNIRANVGLREDLVSLLLSYDLQWLRLGLEVVLGVSISPLNPVNGINADLTELSSNRIAELWRGGIKRVLNSHLFHCEELKAMHFVEGEVPTPAMEKKYHSDMCKHILRTFLVLVLLLDRARLSGMCNGRTALFRATKNGSSADVKSSNDILIAFCKKFLKAEGNVIKHLGNLEYRVSYIQSYFDEFDFSVQDISTDLKDGVRLCQLVNILVNSTVNSNSDRDKHLPLIDATVLRIPAISRLQKLHNVGLVTSYIKSNLRLDIPFEDKCIVEGQENATLLLLWMILFEFDLKLVVSVNSVRAETDKVMKILSADGGAPEDESHNAVMSSELYCSQVAAALQCWLSAVASTYNIHSGCDAIDSLSSLLEGGEVLCLVIHFYHNALIPADVIKSIVGDDTNNHDDLSITDISRSMSFCKQTNTQRKYFQAVQSACADLGGIPSIIPTADSAPSLDDRTLVIFLGFLFSRLIDTSMKWKAASIIQKVFRNTPRKNTPKKKNDKNLSENAAVHVQLFMYSKHDAARIICTFMKKMSIFLAAKRKIQSIENKEKYKATCQPSTLDDNLTQGVSDFDEVILFGESCENYEEQNCTSSSKTSSGMDFVVCEETAMTPTQSSALEFSNGETSPTLHIELPSLVKFAAHAAVMAQISTHSKLLSQVKSEASGRIAAEKMIAEMREAHEKTIRDAESMKLDLERKLAFEISEKSRIQREFEEKAEEEKQRIELEKQQQIANHAAMIHAALMIQHVVKTRKQKAAELRTKMSIRRSFVTIQALFRGCRLRKQLRLLTSIVVSIQKSFKRYSSDQKAASVLHTSSNVIARFIRVSVLKLRLEKKINAVSTVQRGWRCYHAKKRLLLKSQAVVRMQAAVRCYQAQKNFTLVVRKVIRIQQYTRAQFVKLMNRKNQAARLMSKCWRTYKDNKCSYSLRLREQKLRDMLTVRAGLKIIHFMKTSAVKLKKYEAVSKIARWFLYWRPLLRVRKLIKGFKRLQAFRRSILVRRSQTKAVQASYHKLLLANQRSMDHPELRLGQQTISALRVLQMGKMISHVLKACQSLETCTFYSSVCCKNFVLSSASQILFSLIRSCNRSTPHQELLRCALVVLLNVTRDPLLASDLSHNGDTTELLVDLMQMFRDKKMIFNLACELLTRLVSAQDSIKSECLSEEMKKRLDGILHILERKHRLDMRVKTFKSSKSANMSPLSVGAPNVASTFELMSELMKVVQQ